MKQPYPEYPAKTEWMMRNALGQLTPEQRHIYISMARLSDLLNLAMRSDVDRTSGKYLSMLFTDFLDKLYETAMQKNNCAYKVLLDDFVKVAMFSLPALRHIVAQPSTQLVKNTEKVHMSKVKQTSPATMRWLARKPGRSVAEKISPQNKVQAKMIHFSTNTKENQETIYLYNQLHNITMQRASTPERSQYCSHCPENLKKECAADEKEIHDLLALQSRIKQGDLSEVPPIRQRLQNNKLMCDKYYKVIWDSTRMLSELELKLKQDWGTLEARYQQICFWLALATLLHETRTVIYDYRGALHDEDGLLWFGNSEKKSTKELNSILIFPHHDPTTPVELAMEEDRIILRKPNSTTVLLEYLIPPLLIDINEQTDGHDQSIPMDAEVK